MTTQDPAMQMLGALMLAQKIPTRHLLNARGAGLLRAEFTLTVEGAERLPQITGMVVTAAWDPARYQTVYTADLEYGPKPPPAGAPNPTGDTP